MPRFVRAAAIGAALFLAVATHPGMAEQPAGATPPRVPVIHYQTRKVDSLHIFYAEAGPADAPIVLLLHGFPSASTMFRNLIPLLADKYHVIAPDYPGFGESDAPSHTQFAYTFDNIADIVDDLLGQLGARQYAVYIFDYGAPIGYRLALKHPERVSALIIQNGNAYAEGLGDFWKPIREYWASPTAAHRDALGYLVAPEGTKFQYLAGVKDVTRVDPANWRHDQPLLDRPGNKDIQIDLFYDYRTNLTLYPQFQAFFRTYHPPALIVWGKNDPAFIVPGARAYLQDLPKAEFYLIDSGHYALEDRLDVMAPLIRDFLDRRIGGT